MSTVALSAPRARIEPRPAKKPPSALTERRLSMICEKIANGVPMIASAVAAGVPRRTFQEWLEKGRREDAIEPYKSMAERIEYALALYHESRVSAVVEGAVRDPRLAQWELERRFPDEWGQVQRSEVTVTARPMIDASKCTTEELALLMELLRKVAPGEAELPADGVSAVSLLELGSGE